MTKLTDGMTDEQIAELKADKKAALAEARAMASNEPERPERPNEWFRSAIDSAQNKMPDLTARLFGKR